MTASFEKRPTVVCLCGSTRFFTKFQEANYQETMNGKIVLSVGFYPHASVQAHGQTIGITNAQKEALDELHRHKIEMADEVLVISEGGYIGASTFAEVDYALYLGKPVFWLELEARQAFAERSGRWAIVGCGELYKIQQ